MSLSDLYSLLDIRDEGKREILDELDERLDKAIAEIQRMRLLDVAPTERQRLAGKVSGLKTVKDWLRSY